MQITISLDVIPEMLLAASEDMARSLAEAICELVPPTLKLLKKTRTELAFDLEELICLALLFQKYNEQEPDTSFGSHQYLVAMLDTLGWDGVRENLLELMNPRGLEGCSALLVTDSIENDLKILALLDGLRTAWRLTEEEQAEHVNYLTIEQAICEVFELPC